MPHATLTLTRRAFGGALCLAAAACGRRAGRGGVARRVVTLAPSATEVLFALGAGARVVGVSRYDDYPPEVARLPRVGGGLDPSFEAIVALRPDAVIGTSAGANRTVVERLGALGIRTLFPSIESLAEIRASVQSFGALVGAADRAPAVLARIDARLAAVRDAVRGRAAPTVLAVYGQRPLVIAGPGSFVDELIGLAGARNASRTGPRWPQVSLEAVMALGPDVVLDVTVQDGAGTLREAWSGYTAIPAVRDGRVQRLEDPVLMRPGPRVGDALAMLARAIHPGLVA